jgi:hypothetical protein
MITPQQFERLIQALPILSHADPALLRDFQQAASFIGFYVFAFLTISASFPYLIPI